MKKATIDGITCYTLSWKDIERDTLQLARRLDYRPTLIVGILRGAATIATLLSNFLNLKEVRFIGIRYYRGIGKRGKMKIYQKIGESLKGENVLLVDDVVDTGESLKKARQIIQALRPRNLKTATLHVKPWARTRPDYFVKKLRGWIIYPWEKAEFMNEFLEKVAKKHTRAQIDAIFRRLGLSKKYLVRR